MFAIIMLIIIFFLYLTWRFGTRNFGYWKKKGVKHDEPMFFVGNLYKQFTQKLSISEQIAEWYEKFPEEQYVGVHMANDVGLVLRDPELVKRVLVTDFKCFHGRGLNSHKHVREMLYFNLFMADGDVWKLLRQRLTPAFSSGKLKAMFPLIVSTAEKMLSITKAGNQDVRELVARYATDFIGACGFGLEIDSLNEDSSMFRRLGKRIVTFNRRDALAQLAKRVAPELFKHVKYFASEVEQNTLHMVKMILNNRNYKPSGRNDFIDLLLELKQKGKIVGQSMEHFNPDGTPKIVDLELDEKLIAAQVFVFFAAGFETSSSASSFLLHELAFHPEVQKKCHDEIDQVLSKHDGKLCYEAIKEMEYLEMTFRETLRLHPSPGYLIRKSDNKYTFPGTGLTIDEDVLILVPLHSLQRDPRYFDDPETFKPERFSSENVDSIKKYVYLPFGEGPRACIGARLGVMQSLTGVAALLSRFSVEPAPTTVRHPLVDPRSFFVENIQGGLPLRLVRRTTAK